MYGSLDLPSIVRLLQEFERLHDARQDCGPVLAVLERETQFPDLGEFLRWELIRLMKGVEHVAERLAVYQPVKPQLDREELLKLVRRISANEGSEAEIDEAIEVFQANCKHPSGSDLIFWPNLVPEFGQGREPTVEEIVDLAMRGRA
jgi:Colicin immunity protein / pyocin immunity protein